MTYIVCELVKDGDVIACWSSRIPSVTGPRTLEADADRLAGRGWRVYRVEA